MSARLITVAIVEDDDLIAMALAEMLKEAGTTVVAAAHSYEDAIAILDAGPPCEVIFVDLFLHGRLTGVDVARRAARKGISVVVMTGETSLPKELSGVALLLKPYSIEQVRAILHQIRRPHRP
jgi:DNA-binding response OmpR family regulator